MTSHLNAAFEAASKLPPEEQIIFAEFLLAELKDEEDWRQTFSRSSESLVNLAREARGEYLKGSCKPLDELPS